MKKRIILCALVMVLFFSADVSAASKFKDVKETAWYYKYLSPLVDAKVIDGMPDGTFQGNATLNADQLLKLMVTTINPYASYERELGQKSDGTLVPIGKWFSPYLSVLLSMNLIEPIETEVKGENFTYKQAENISADYYNKPITREEVAYWIAKGYDFLRYKAHDFDETSDENIKKALQTWYKDFDQIDSKYYKPIYVLHETGIMEGADDGGFWPKKVLTRAEVTAVIYRLQKARYKEISEYNIDYTTDTARWDYVLRKGDDGNLHYEKVIVKNGYVYSPDKMSETSRIEYTGGTGIKQVTTKNIDTSAFPVVDDPDTDEWGEDAKGLSDAEKARLKELYGIN